MQVVAFDLDGVIVDSVGVVRAAYASAGVIAPANILSCEGDKSWLHDQVAEIARTTGTSQDAITHAVRILKNANYIAHISSAGKLPPYEVAKRLRRDGLHVMLLTGAPVGTIDALRNVWRDWPFHDVSRDGLSTHEKMRILADVSDYVGTGCYVDDQTKFVTCDTFGWTFIHYTGQSAVQLYDQIEESRRNHG